MIGIAPRANVCYDCIMEITKYGILSDELALAEARAVQLRRELEGLDATPCNIGCSCGEQFETEGDFARHFVISRANRMNRFLNLGECPNSEKGKVIIAGATIGG